MVVESTLLSCGKPAGSKQFHTYPSSAISMCVICEPTTSALPRPQKPAFQVQCHQSRTPACSLPSPPRGGGLGWG